MVSGILRGAPKKNNNSKLQIHEVILEEWRDVCSVASPSSWNQQNHEVKGNKTAETWTDCIRTVWCVFSIYHILPITFYVRKGRKTIITNWVKSGMLPLPLTVTSDWWFSELEFFFTENYRDVVWTRRAMLQERSGKSNRIIHNTRYKRTNHNDNHDNHNMNNNNNNNQQPTTNSQQPTTNNQQQPTTNTPSTHPSLTVSCMCLNVGFDLSFINPTSAHHVATCITTCQLYWNNVISAFPGLFSNLCVFKFQPIFIKTLSPTL